MPGGSVTIRWHPPLDRLFGLTSAWPLGGPTPVARVLAELAACEPRFSRYARRTDGSLRPEALLVWRRGEVLGLDDRVDPGDEVEILVLVTGG